MVKVVITHPGDVVVDEFEALVEQPTLPPLAEPPTIGLVQIATSQPTDSAADILAKLVTVDGAGSGLDADLLDGQHGAYYLPAANYTAADVLAKLTTVDGAGSGVDADLLDGNDSAYFATAAGLALKLDASAYTAADVLAKTKTVDGAGSGLDADLLDGQDGAAYLALAGHTGTISDAQHGNRGGGALHAAATAAVAGFMTDAPSDSSTYGRRNGAWSVAAAGLPEAPNDANAYVRSALAWVVGYTKAAIDTLLGNKADTTAMTAADNLRITTVTLTPQLSSGSYVKPADLKFLEVIVIGGGGGSSNLGAAPTGNSNAGGGGAGAGVTIGIFAASALAASEPYTVGAGAGASSGAAGGTSTFKGLSATGGGSGSGSGSGTSFTYAGGGVPGIGSGGVINTLGENGGYGWRAAHGLATLVICGSGGGNIMAPRHIEVPGQVNGTDGNYYGGGARGTGSTNGGGAATGGAGRSGAVIFKEYR